MCTRTSTLLSQLSIRILHRMALLDKVSGDLNIYIGGFVSRNFTPDNATWYTDSDM